MEKPEKLKRYAEILNNADETETSTDMILERFLHLQDAADELAVRYIQDADDSEDMTASTFNGEVPDYFDTAVAFAIQRLYEIGVPIVNFTDVNLELEREQLDREFNKEHGSADDSWFPETPDETQLTAELLYKASLLSLEDKEPAFRPHHDGRNHELLDSPQTLYNKYGSAI